MRARKSGQIMAPKLIDRVLNTGYRLFPDSPQKGQKGAAGDGEGQGEAHQAPGVEALAFAHIMHGIHW